MTKYIQVCTTVGEKADATKLATMLVTKHLAACVQVVGPITSVYRWKGKNERAKEWLCIAKTRATLFDRVEKAIRTIHPYNVPEILATPIAQGNTAYLKWLDGELKKKPAHR